MYGLISGFLENWTSFYSNHAVVRTLLGFLHIGGLVIGGGSAIWADRTTLLASRQGASQRVAQLQALRGTHRIVLGSLTAVTASGLLLLAADSDALLHSIFFWVKMGLIAGLLANGALLTRAEREAESDVQGWQMLRVTPTISVALWTATTLAGAALPNVG